MKLYIVSPFYSIVEDSHSSRRSIVRSLALVRPCFGLLYAHVPFFQISYYSLTIIFVSASSSCFTLTVSMREEYCMGYITRAWGLRSL